MQFIEKNSFNVRSAVYHLKKQGFGPQFILFPMIHVGDRNFFVEVSQRLAQCDLILAEGVASKRAALLTSAYRIVRKVHRLDLITQYEMDTSKLKDKMVNADMEPEDFDRQYSTLPTLVRLQIFVLFPFFALYLLLCGTRQIIARELAVEDLPSSEEILRNDVFEDFDNLILDQRDSVLIHRLQELCDARNFDGRKIAVLYGAMHMRNITAFLVEKLRYQVSRAEWLTVFEL